ncbi:hypothetical protein XELAEV_18017442mg [Xenopus laevis]|uniref:Uncharacterized protein n=1 Tax=Xenopus laevis TaxID=8355 RepID=A0A974DBC6_XENLA|nr:hypothetical protein XELAEV_18017442mg [Xenopus laevis]
MSQPITKSSPAIHAPIIVRKHFLYDIINASMATFTYVLPNACWMQLVPISSYSLAVTDTAGQGAFWAEQPWSFVAVVFTLRLTPFHN